MIKRVGEYREMDKSLGKSTGDTLAKMAEGKYLPCAQVFVRASWLEQLVKLNKAKTAAVKKAAKAARAAAQAP